MGVPAKRLALLVSMALVGVLPLVVGQPAAAHQNGCHAAHSCPSDSGSYVCGDTGNFTYCGYTTLPEPVVYDFDAPNRPRVESPTAGPGGLVTLVVTAERGAQLRVTSDGKRLFTTVATGTAQEITFQAEDGEHAYRVTATDASDNTSNAASFKLTTDATRPEAEPIFRSGNGVDARSSVQFEPSEPVTYVVKVDGTKVARDDVGVMTAEVFFALPNGKHQVTLRLTDGAGNTKTYQQKLKVDIAALTPVLQRASGNNEPDQEFMVSGTPGSKGTVRLGWELKRFTLTGKTALVSFSLPDGSYPAPEVAVEDQFGRVGSTTAVPFVVDTVAPSLRVAQMRDSATYDNTGWFAAAIATEAGAAVEWSLIDAADERIAIKSYTATGAVVPVRFDLEEGTYRIVVEATDPAGNATGQTLEVQVTADPLTLTDWLITLVILALLILAGRAVWRRVRRKRREPAAKRRSSRGVRARVRQGS